jgi:hypothetical protein
MIKGFEPIPIPRASPFLRYTSKERENMEKQAAKIMRYNAKIKELRNDPELKNDPKNKYLSYVLEDKKKAVITNLTKLGLNLDEIVDMIEYEIEYEKSVKEKSVK